MRNRKPLVIVLSLFVLSGILLTVIQAPLGWSFLAWVALVPFALACAPQVKPRTLAFAALVVGYLYWLGNVYWIVPITIIGWLAMCLYLALFWVLPALAVRFARAKGLPLFIALPILVAGWERLQGFPMGGFFWRFLGHSQYQNLALIQIADILGAAGISFVVAMVNGLLVDLVLFFWRRRVGCAHQEPPGSEQVGGHSPPYGVAGPRHPSGRIIIVGFAATIVVVISTVLYGQWRLGQSTRYVTEGPLVASLQSNVPISVKRSHQKSVEIFDELMDRSKAAAAAGADLIVWPETMVQGLLDPYLWSCLKEEEGEFDQDKAFHNALCEHAKGNAYVLVGAPGAEIRRDQRGQLYVGNYNSAYFYRPDGTRDPARYDKIHPVFLSEYNPFKRSFPWLFERLKVFFPKGWNPDYSLDRGTRYTIFEMATKRVSSLKSQVSSSDSELQTSNFKLQTPYHFAVIICYEDTIPYVGRNFALDPQGRKRVDWLVNISNDGWFVRFENDPARVIPSTELPQHAAICAFRAVENRLPIVRSVNTGISCLVESTGRIRDGYLAASDNFPRRAMERTAMAGWFLDRLPIDKRVTFYSRHGEWFADSCAVLFVAVLVWPLGARLVTRRAKA
ncbi:MAG: apolipoprotein N-acyltransferase [Planctomycetes bacterium]|nr:apolipoprotein N-acyltransferase [Planctomycetota bacterium]